MEKSAPNVFKDALDKAFSGVKPNLGTMTDHAMYKQGVREEDSEDKGIRELDKDEQGMVYGIADILRRVDDIENRRKMAKDMVNKFKREKIKFDYKKFLNLCKLGEDKKDMKEESLEGGVADGKTLLNLAKKHAYNDSTDSTSEDKIKKVYNSLKSQLEKGIKVEMEHTKSKAKAKEIAMDHISEDPKYYDKLEKVETKEATGSGSSGAYSGPVFGGDDAFWERSRSETPKLGESEVEKVEAKEATTSGSVGGYESPSMWAKSTKKKDWGPSRKTQIPGGGFVKIKKKCTKFPYCNQGDINNVKISKNESVKEAIKNVSKKTGISENVIKTILEHEYEKMNKRHN